MSPYDQRVCYRVSAVAQQRCGRRRCPARICPTRRWTHRSTLRICAGWVMGDRRPDACGSVGNSRFVVSSSSPPEPGETGVMRTEVPMSCKRLYSIPFMLANSWSSTIAISRAGKSTVVVLFVGFRHSTLRRASREYIIPLTCSTQAPCTDQSGALFHPRERQAQYLRWDGSQERASYKRKHRGKGICVGRQAVRSQLKRKA
jgi:hypothetical protein